MSHVNARALKSRDKREDAAELPRPIVQYALIMPGLEVRFGGFCPES